MVTNEEAWKDQVNMLHTWTTRLEKSDMEGLPNVEKAYRT